MPLVANYGLEKFFKGNFILPGPAFYFQLTFRQGVNKT